MAETKIQWTGQTWNPTTGCTKITAGCRSCYAEVMHKRLTGMGQPKYSEPFTTVQTHEEELTRSFGKKPKMIFVNSMSDLFHDDVPLWFIQAVFAVIWANPQHIFQVLTKRSDRLAQLSPDLEWPPNLWMGVSVEDGRVASRINDLRASGAAVKWLSIEPLIGPMLGISLHEINWVVVGGESGRNARIMELHWIQPILNTCRFMKIPFFMKQVGTVQARALGYIDKKGGEMLEWPEWLRVREFPTP